MGMSAFTLPTSWATAQSLSGANEIVLAYSERRQALGASAVSNLSSGDSAQDKTLWLAMQQWLESNCTSFVDHVSGPLNSGSTDILYFTLATWRSAAGLNASGFRRSTDGVNFSYGNIQAGDVRGPWVFEDLQKGFAALKWTVRRDDDDFEIVDGKYKAISGDGASCSAAILDQIVNWNAADWESANIQYIILASLEISGTHATGWRASGKAKYKNIPTMCSHEASMYSYFYPYIGAQTPPYEDMDDLGFPNLQYSLIETLGDATTSTRTFVEITSSTTNPIELTNIAVCPGAGDPVGSWTVRDSIALLKWNFTNA